MRTLDNTQLLLQIRSLQEQLGNEDEVGSVRNLIKNLQTTVSHQGITISTLPVPSSPIVNVVRNSDFNYSKPAYTGGGANTDAAHWYKHYQLRVTDAQVFNGSDRIDCLTSAPFTMALFALGTIRGVIYGAKADGSTVSVTLTRISDTRVTMTGPATNANVDAANLELWIGLELNEAHANGAGTVTALETAAVSGAKWSKTTGTALIGSADTTTRVSLDQPLKTNSCTPSSRQYFQVNARLTTGIKPAGVSLYVGVWDDTTQKWLEGDNFTLNATKIGPHTGGATSRKYLVIGTTDYGYQIQSDQITVINTVDPLTTLNYVSLSWTSLVGVNTYDVYQQNVTTGVFYLVTTINNGSSAFFDDGEGVRIDTGFPSITATRWRAFVALPASLFTVVVDNWIVARATILIPNTYNMSATTGKQWLRVGIVDNSGTLAVELDHVALCAAPSNAWNISPLDQEAVGAPDGNPPDDDQGPTGGGGPIFPPGQGGNCVAVTESLWGEGEKDIYVSDLQEGMEIASGLGELIPIGKLGYFQVSSSVIITADDGASIRCSLSHPVIQHLDDFTGKVAFDLRVGDDVLTSDGQTAQIAKVAQLESGGACVVAMISLDPKSPRYAAGTGKRRIVSHNKPIQQGNPV